VFYNC